MRTDIIRAVAVAGALTTLSLSAGASGALAQTAPATTLAAAERAPSGQQPRPRAALQVGRRRLHVVAGNRATVRGTVRAGGRLAAGLSTALQVRHGGGWSTIARDRTSRGGRFSLADRRTQAGSASVRLRVSGARVRARVRSLGRLEVYRTAYASWYGPGLYGNRLGCGGTLSAGTLGVAHKSLPCGTQVTFRKGGRSVRVRVIDRGPYVGGREYDLTAATAQRLGFRGHGAVLATR